MSEEKWEDLVDLGRLAAWMDGKGLGRGAIETPLQLKGGTQNILLRFERAGRPYVLRRSPASPRGDGNVTNRREARVLGALGQTDVPHPRLIAACADTDVIGGAFYLMEPVDGFNAVVKLEDLHAGDPAIRRRMGFALVDGALALAKVDHVAVGLSDFGKADNFLERQVPRWRAWLDSYRDYEGWPGPDFIPRLDDVARWLTEHRPATFKPGILHGDYHLANVMYRHDGPELAAIVDWELATIGDPLLDMGWIMATWPDPDGSRTAGTFIDPWDGFPTIEELMAHYQAKSDRDASNLRWYGVLGCYKLGIILEGTFARACAGKAPVATGDKLHDHCIRLFQRAARWIG
ncbi:MAG: phosphotransferase family protein [Hyphomicrobiales bacterium]|nr:phosphotransferase family protein [Hyphomicrobiales bacterium]